MPRIRINADAFKNQTWGSEWELSNMTCEHGIKIVARHYHTEDTIVYNPNSWAHKWGCKDTKGRMWYAHVDSSVVDHGEGTCEITTPIMTYDDIEDAQQILRDLREEGALASSRYGCGLHIHIGAFNTTDGGVTQTGTSLRHLVNLIKSHEDILIQAINMTPSRYANGYASKLSNDFVRRLNESRPSTIDGVKRIYNRYQATRYVMLNYESLDDNKTVEFRFFEFHKIHAGEFKAYVQFCMALCHYAKVITRSSPSPIDMSNPKYMMKNWLTNMGLVGDEFKTCRKMLTKRLRGDVGSRVPRTRNADLDDLNLVTEG